MMRCLKRLTFAMILLIILLAIFHRPILAGIGYWLDAGKPPRKADFVVLLPGHERTRAFVVAGLVHKGYGRAAIVIPSKLYPSEISHGLRAQHAVGRAVLESEGLTPQQIMELSNHENTSTFADAESIKRFLSDQGDDCQLIVVTNDYHTRRARWAFSQVLEERMEQVRFVSAPADFHSAETWWHSPRGMEAYLSEYFKLSYYMLRYSQQNRILFVSTCSASLVILVFLAIRCSRRKTPAPDEL